MVEKTRLRGARRAACAATAALVFAGAPEARADTSWQGSSTGNWSAASNWSNGAPSTTTDNGTLTFPGEGRVCRLRCNLTNDLAGVRATRLRFGLGARYSISGRPIQLGSGGIQIDGNAPDGTGRLVGDNRLEGLLQLRAAQTWSLGRDQDLWVSGVAGGDLGYDVRVTGTPPSSLRVLKYIEGGKLTLGVPTYAGQGVTLNAFSAQPVVLAAGGDLRASGQVGLGPLVATNGMLTADLVSGGGFFFDSAGAVQLGGTLRVENSSVFGTSCPPAGKTLTILRAAGALTGTFSNVPQGGTVTLQCGNGSVALQVRYDYGQRTVTATVQPRVAGSPQGERRTRTVVVRQGKGPRPPMRKVTLRRGDRLEVGFSGNWYASGYGWELTRRPERSRLKLLRTRTATSGECCGFPEVRTFLFEARSAGRTRLVYTLRGPDGKRDGRRLTVRVRVR